MNTIIKTMCEIVGDHQENGGYLFPYSKQDIPVLLNKDETTFYPEIRISPFKTRLPNSGCNLVI